MHTAKTGVHFFSPPPPNILAIKHNAAFQVQKPSNKRLDICKNVR